MKKSLPAPRPAAATALVAALAAVSCTAGAAEPQERTLPLWEAGVGAFALSTPAYPAASDRSSRVLGLPFLLYRGKVLRSDQSGIGARLLRTDAVEFDVGFAASLPARSSEVAVREGMPNLGTLVEFGPRVKFKLGNPTQDSRLRFEVPLRTVIEVRGGLQRQGWTLEPRLVWETREERAGWNFDASVGFVAGDAAINRYFYEVAPQYATAARPAYRAQSGLILLRTGLFASRRVTPDVRLFGFVRYDSYAQSANRDSPLFRKDAGASAGIGFAWTLGRSVRPASE